MWALLACCRMSWPVKLKSSICNCLTCTHYGETHRMVRRWEHKGYLPPWRLGPDRNWSWRSHGRGRWKLKTQAHMKKMEKPTWQIFPYILQQMRYTYWAMFEMWTVAFFPPLLSSCGIVVEGFLKILAQQSNANVLHCFQSAEEINMATDCCLERKKVLVNGLLIHNHHTIDIFLTGDPLKTWFWLFCCQYCFLCS